jgi:large subunit ribosomal protein L1
MAKLTKNQKLAAEKIEAGKLYTVAEAAALVKEITTTKFDASVDIDVRLGVDPRKANQMVRGVVSLPNGTGKVVRVSHCAVLTRKLLLKRQVLTM